MRNVSKYGVGQSKSAKLARTDENGVLFASKGEMKRWWQLQLMERAGEISGLKRQVPFDLFFTDQRDEIVRIETPAGRCMKYIADFEYRDKKGKQVVEDFKGMDTDASAIKRAMVKAFHGITIEVVK